MAEFGRDGCSSGCLSGEFGIVCGAVYSRMRMGWLGVLHSQGLTMRAKGGATRRAAGLFDAGFVARSSQIQEGHARRFRLACAKKCLAANVTVFMF